MPWNPVLTRDGRELITVTTPTEVTCWDVGTRSKKHVIPVADRLAALVPSPDGRRLAVLDLEGCQLWDLSIGRPEGKKFSPVGERPLADWSPDGSALLLSQGDIQVLQRTFPPRTTDMSLVSVTAAIPHQSQVRTLEYSPSGEHIATADSDSVVRLWRPRDETRIRQVVLPVQGGAMWSPDRKHVTPTFYDLYRNVTRTRVSSLPDCEPAGEWLEPGGVLQRVSFSPDGAWLATVSVADVRHGETRLVVPPEAPISIDLWDWRNGDRLWRVRAPGLPAEWAWTAEGRRLVVRCVDGQILAIDPSSGKTASQIRHRASSQGIGLAPYGEQFITWGRGEPVRIWSTDTGSERIPGLERSVEAFEVVFSRDGERLAAVSLDHSLHVWELATGRLVSTRMAHPGPVLGLDLAGGRLLTLGRDRFVRLWDWRRGELAGTPFEQRFLKHTAKALILPYPDGAVMSVSEDSVRVVDARTGKPILPPMEFRLSPWSLSGSEGTVLIASSTSLIVDTGIQEAGNAGGRLPPAGWKDLAAIVSGRTVHEGGSVRLPAAAWLERWEALRRMLPDDFALDLSREGRHEWHRKRAAAHEALFQWDAAVWHLDRLGPAATLEDRGRRARVRSFVQGWRFAPRTQTWHGAVKRRLDPLDRDAIDDITRAAASTPLVRSRGPFIDFLERYPENASLSLGYATRAIVSPERRRVRFLAGSDDTLRVWLNSTEIHSLAELGPAVTDYVTISVELAPGENVLLVEVGQSGGGWGLYFRIEDADGRRLELTDDGRLEPLDEGARRN